MPLRKPDLKFSLAVEISIAAAVLAILLNVLLWHVLVSTEPCEPCNPAISDTIAAPEPSKSDP